MKRMTVENFRSTVEWEGHEYALTEMHPEEMPTEEGTALLEKAQANANAFFAYIEKLCDE